MSSRGQALVMFALLLPAVLLPVAALTVETARLSVRAAHLQAAAAQAALDVAQALDVSALRSGEAFRLDPEGAREATAAALTRADPNAVLDAVRVDGLTITLHAHEEVGSLFGQVLGASARRIEAGAGARLTPGYGRPSS